MTAAEKLGYLANLNRVKAQQTIHLGKFDPFNHQAVYALWMAAFGNERLARKAQAMAAEANVNRACNQARR
jgi:hypothetical protein